MPTQRETILTALADLQGRSRMCLFCAEKFCRNASRPQVS